MTVLKNILGTVWSMHAPYTLRSARILHIKLKSESGGNGESSDRVCETAHAPARFFQSDAWKHFGFTVSRHDKGDSMQILADYNSYTPMALLCMCHSLTNTDCTFFDSVRF